MHERGFKEGNESQKNSLIYGSACLANVYNQIRKLAGAQFSLLVYNVSNLFNTIIYNIFKVIV